MREVLRRPAADRDLIESYRYYAREAGQRVADRFFANAEEAFARIARFPELGTRYHPEEPLHAELRYFPITGFRSYLIYYRLLPDGIEVLRVLHGARDIDSILAEGFDLPDEDDAGLM